MDLLVRVLVAAAAFAATALLATRWSRLLLGRGPIPVAALSVVAAAGAAAAHGAPTALSGIDIALRAAFAASITAASARARRQVWLFASTATVVAGTGAAYDWLAFVATGATLALLVLDRRSWIVGAFIGACLSQVLLRLDLPGTTGTSAVVAAAVAGLLVGSGLRRSRRSTRRRAWITAGLLAGAAVVFSAGGALAAAGAAGDVRAGIDAGRDGLAAARRDDVPEATRRFDHAADSFGRAGAALGRWWTRPALAVPVVGQHLRALRTLSAAGEELAGAASSSTSELDLKGLRVERGAIDLAAVARADGALTSAGRALDRAAANVESVRSPWLVAPLVKAIGDLDVRMAEARRDIGTAADVLSLAGPMLGRDGPRRWFLAVVTPAENRGSGGLVGSTAEITAQAGKLDLVAVGRIAQLNEAVDDGAAARVLPPIYAEVYGDWKVPARLQNVTVAADFPTAATALESVLPLAGRGDVDGVISVDPLAVAALLKAIGPVSVPSWPVPISADNAASVLLHEQYVALSGDARENFLGEVIHAVWVRATSGSLPSPSSLSQALGPALRGHHIQFHSRQAQEQATLGRLGADGALHHAGGDHLGLVTDNASQSKIDWFLRRAVDYHVRLDPGSGKAEATVKVTLTNDAPASGLPAYVLGGQVAPPGFSRQIVQVYTPLDLVSATVDGRPAATTGLRSLGRSENWAHELDVTVPPTSAMTIELRLAGRLTEPSGHWSLAVDRQPAVRPDDVTVTFDLADGWSIASTSGGLTGRGQTASARLNIDRDAQLGVEMRRR
ncbi:MAG: DUF4012 domain-containing protein [Actinobacteria bacterium]|nr:DUF4012 domain-containing protein [Actinomycetota bacterium]